MRDVPPNSHLVLDFVARYSVDLMPTIAPLLNRWGSSVLSTYIRTASAADAQAIQAALPAFIDRHVRDDMPSRASQFMKYRLKPVTSLHFADAKTQGAFKPGADPLFVSALGVMGVVTLLIALVNYISLATARAGLRGREVAVRKVMGATRRALVVQFVGESVVLALVAGLIAAAMAEAALPAVSAMLGEPITLNYFGAQGVALPLIGLCLAVGLLAGVYPAIVLSAFRPASVLASARTPGGGRAGARVRQVMAIGQFAIAICLMICTAVIFSQTEFVRHADLGFRRDGLILVKGLGEQQVAKHRRSVLEAFRSVPGVISATASDRRPATDEENNTNVLLVSNPSVQPTLTVERMGSDYVRTYGLRVVAGRPLGLQQRLDDKGGIDAEIIAGRGLNVMINAGAARALGFTPAGVLGQRLRIGKTSSGRDYVGTVVGVTQDVRFLSPRTPAPPQIYLQDTGLGSVDNATGWTAAVRVPESELPAVRRRLEALWRTMEPGTPFQAETVQAALKPYYDPDARRAQLFAVGATLSAVIACLGLYGLAAFNTSRRFKEIGIRKTLGASTADVMRLLIGEFLKPVLWANLIAWPLGFFAMRAWLAGFDQRISLNPAYFLLPTAAALLVAVLTVADQAFRVARAEPAKALRYE
jgi:putative ABC transport system permease protein